VPMGAASHQGVAPPHGAKGVAEATPNGGLGSAYVSASVFLFSSRIERIRIDLYHYPIETFPFSSCWNIF
jgi:hypothetical protein